MPATTARGYSYLVPGDAPDLPGGTQALATSVDADITNLQQARMQARSTTLSIPDSTNTPVGSYDVGTVYNVGSIGYSAGVFTVGVDGLYRWELSVGWPATAAAHSRQMGVRVNGVDTRSVSQPVGSSSFGTMEDTRGATIPLNATDTVEAIIFQSTGASMTVTPLAFSLVRVG